MASGDILSIIKNQRKNYIINGSMSFSQRGASFNSANGYTLDRHYCFRQGGLPNLNVSWDASNPRPLPMLDHWLYMSRGAGDTSISAIETVHALETKDCLELQGKLATLSFYGFCGADFSAVDSKFDIVVTFGRGIDEGAVATWTGATTIGMSTEYPNADRVLTTSHKRFSFSFNVPSDCTQIRYEIIYDPTGTAGASDFFAVTGIMLNEGPLAEFTRAGNTYEGEFDLCRRYFWRRSDSDTQSVVVTWGTGYNSGQESHPVRMRIVPAMISAGGFQLHHPGFFLVGVTHLVLSSTIDRYTLSGSQTVSGGGTAAIFQTSTGGAYLQADAEL